MQASSLTGEKARDLAAMMERFGSQATRLVQELLPYRNVERARTSFPPGTGQGPALFQDQRRPAAAYRRFSLRARCGAAASCAFFANVAPIRRAAGRSASRSRIFARAFLPRVGPHLPGKSWLYEKLGVTSGRRSLYDELMLSLHDAASWTRISRTIVRISRWNFRPAAAGWFSPIRCCMPLWAANSRWSRPSISISPRWPSLPSRR
jgi:hypothetical protein